jgi:hypothetical protein
VSVAFVLGTQANGASVTATTVSVSYTVQANDILLVSVSASSNAGTGGNAPTITAGSANMIRLWSFTAQAVATAIFYRVVQAGDPTSYTFTASGGVPISGMAVRYSGVDTTNPFRNWNGIGSLDNFSGTTTTVQFPALDNLQPNDMVVGFAAYGRTTKASTITAYTTPTNWTSRQTITGPVSGSTAFPVYSAFYERLGANDQPTVTGQAGHHNAFVIALVPADNTVPDQWGEPVGFVAAATAVTTVTNTTSLSVNKPTGVVDGDLMILAAGQSRGGAVYTTPAGWLPIELAIGGKLASGEASSYSIGCTIAGSTPQEMSLAIAAYRRPRNPAAIKLHGSSWSTALSTTSPVPYALPQIKPDELIVMIYVVGGDASGSYTVTAPSSPWVQRVSVVSAVATDFNVGIIVVDKPAASDPVSLPRGTSQHYASRDRPTCHTDASAQALGGNAGWASSSPRSRTRSLLSLPTRARSPILVYKPRPRSHSW